MKFIGAFVLVALATVQVLTFNASGTVFVTERQFGSVTPVRRENKVKELDLTRTCPALTGREAVVGTMPDTLQLANDPNPPGGTRAHGVFYRPGN